MLRFIKFHNRQHPATLGAREIEAFLSHLTLGRHVSVGTQKVALNALIFLYNQFLQMPVKDLSFRYAKASQRIPTVLSQQEVSRIIGASSQPFTLMFSILYGSGLRIAECLNLRVLDIENSTITVRRGKGNKSRVTLLPQSLKASIESQIKKPRKQMLTICPADQISEPPRTYKHTRKLASHKHAISGAPLSVR